MLLTPPTRPSFLLTPLREGRLFVPSVILILRKYFYSRPCGRGDVTRFARNWQHLRISTHAPAGGATR